MATATTTGADIDLDGSDTAADEFYRRLRETDAQKPSEDDGEQAEETPDANDEDAEETSEETPEEDEEAEDEGETEEDEESEQEEEQDEDQDEEDSDNRKDTKDKKPTVIDSDDAIVKLKVDGQEVTASIKDLKRLYGQEASLTRKSQEAAELKKRAEDSGTKYVAGLETLLNRAKAQAEPYANINFLALTKDPNVSSEEISALSEAAQKAFDNVRYLESELDDVVKQAFEQRQQQLISAAKESIKVLSDPKTGIPGWNEQMYNDIRRFAVDQGMNENIVNELVDPVAFKVLHMAMQYQKGKQAVAKTKKVDKTPKKIIKGTPEETIRQVKGEPKKTSMKRLEKSGSIDDATEAFLSRWGG